MSSLIRLAEIAKRVNKKNVDLNVNKVVTVTSFGKLVDPLSYFDYEVASKDQRNYKIVAENNFVYNPSRINIGSIAFNNSNEQVIVSPMYEVFEIDIERIEPEYLMLFLMSRHAKFQIENKTEKGARFRFTIDSLMSMVMSLPDLKTQYDVLNKETTIKNYINQLEAELEARTKQYEYYRNQLLDYTTSRVGFPRIDKMLQELCPDGVDKYSLEEITGYSSTRIKAQVLDSNNYIGVDNILPNKNGIKESIYTPEKGSLTEFVVNDVLIGNIRPYLKKVWLADKLGGTNGDVLVIRIKDNFGNKIAPRFLFYSLSSNSFFDFMISSSKGSKMPRGDKKAVMTYQIWLPPLPIQAEIVRILDQFSDYTSSNSQGLPAEIELRLKQYEYYRNKLLTF